MLWWIALLVTVNAAIWGAVLLRARRRRKVWIAAFLEQGAVELNHHSAFRHDQRLNALQQRISRDLGKRHAFSPSVRKKLERELRRIEKEGR